MTVEELEKRLRELSTFAVVRTHHTLDDLWEVVYLARTGPLPSDDRYVARVAPSIEEALVKCERAHGIRK